MIESRKDKRVSRMVCAECKKTMPLGSAYVFIAVNGPGKVCIPCGNEVALSAQSAWSHTHFNEPLLEPVALLVQTLRDRQRKPRVASTTTIEKAIKSGRFTPEQLKEIRSLADVAARTLELS